MADATAGAPAPRGVGVSFPRVDGARSTTATGRAVFEHAARAVDPALADRIAADPAWRKGYVQHIRDLCEAELRDPTAADLVPAAGLASLHDRFTFVRDGEELPLHRALGQLDRHALGTVTVEGRGAGEEVLTVPYGGERLREEALDRQLERWTGAGTVEPTFADAVRQVMEHPEWLDLSDRTFVLLGAGAEMGPLRQLSRWGATLAPVDVPRPELWNRLLAVVREGRGRAVVPVHDDVADGAADDRIAAVAGADLVAATPEVHRWLAALPGPVTLGNYVYADGADNARVAMAVDALTAALLGDRDDVSLAMLATPTDVYAAPPAAVAASAEAVRARRASLVERAARTASGGRLYRPNYDRPVTTPDGRTFGIADALVVQQGPNYLLAKRLQRWRAREARRTGVRTSANVAPATRTRSVTKNRVLAAAYAGASRFGVEIFEPDTSNTLMAALLVHDLRRDGAVADPATRLGHPLELFTDGAAHGGLWRIPFAPRSVLPIAALFGMARGG